MSESLAPTRPRGGRPSRLVGAWLLVATIAVVAAGVWWFGARGLEPVSTELEVTWWMLAVGFLAVESAVIHLHFRSESGTFSLLELPLVFGLLFAAPTDAILGLIVGAFVALRLVRRQPLLKLAFNLANLSLHITLALVVLDLALGGRDPLAPSGWLAILLATLVTATVNFSLILTAIAITEREFSAHRAVSALSFALVVSLANTVQALVAVLIVVAEPLGVLLLLCSSSVLFVAYRAYAVEREQRERVEFLYASTRALREGGDSTSAVSMFLAEAASMFRATTVMLYLFPAPDSDEGLTQFTLRDGDFRVGRVTDRAERDARALAAAVPMPSFVSRDDVGPTGVFEDYDLSETMVGALQSPHRLVGVLVVADRLGDVSTFTATDLHLFSTLVEHAAISVENDQLGQSLVQMREIGQALEHQASYDALTGLLNRTTFAARLDEHYLSRGDACVLYIDLDDFKLVNDTFGHAAGDGLLTQVARRLEAAVRPTDVAARLGGDEFAVLLGRATDAEAVAYRVIGSLSAPFHITANDVRIGASIGVARQAGATSASQLLEHADLALYAAKEAGKGTVATYSDDLRQDLTRRQMLQSDLRRAIAHRDFEVHYQPIVRLENLSVVGAEALVRWQHPSGRLVTPAEFIREAERVGLMTEVDRIVRHSVLEQLGALRELDQQFFVAINMAARNVFEPGLVDELASEVLASGVPPSALVLELTESVLTHDADVAVERLEEIGALGVRLALDEFGTGRSSMGSLRRLPIDLLKIARPFVADMAAGDPSFVLAINDLGRRLGFTVVAAGVEDAGVLGQLREIGCELAQGFHLGRPIDAASLRRLIVRGRVEPAPVTGPIGPPGAG